MEADVTLITIDNGGKLVIFETNGPVTIRIIPTLEPEDSADIDSVIGFAPPTAS